MNDDRDAWLDDVRRWFFGGTPPSGDLPADLRRAPVGPARQESAPASASLPASSDMASRARPTQTIDFKR